jgi:hypothetical protein
MFRRWEAPRYARTVVFFSFFFFLPFTISKQTCKGRLKFGLKFLRRVSAAVIWGGKYNANYDKCFCWLNEVEAGFLFIGATWAILYCFCV